MTYPYKLYIITQIYKILKPYKPVIWSGVSIADLKSAAMGETKLFFLAYTLKSFFNLSVSFFIYAKGDIK